MTSKLLCPATGPVAELYKRAMSEPKVIEEVANLRCVGWVRPLAAINHQTNILGNTRPAYIIGSPIMLSVTVLTTETFASSELSACTILKGAQPHIHREEHESPPACSRSGQEHYAGSGGASDGL